MEWMPSALDEDSFRVRDKIVQAFLKEVKQKVEKIIKGREGIEYAIIFPSKMNKPNFQYDQNLKTA
jgi:hypothetical protein